MIQLIMDQDTGRSKGYGFITYSEAEDAKKALEQVKKGRKTLLIIVFSPILQFYSITSISQSIILC